MDSLGLAYVPFTFPTVTVRRKMELGGVIVSNGEVDRIWEIYRKAVMADQIPVFTRDLGGAGISKILSYLSEHGISKMTSVSFLNAANEASGDFGFRYIDPKTAREGVKEAAANVKAIVEGTAKTVGDAAGLLTKPITDNLKWLTLGAVVLGGGFIAYRMGLFNQLTTKKRRR